MSVFLVERANFFIDAAAHLEFSSNEDGMLTETNFVYHALVLYSKTTAGTTTTTTLTCLT